MSRSRRRLPRFIDILASRYRITRVNTDELATDWAGVTLHHQQLIKIAESSIPANPDVDRIVLMHEAMHALVYQHGFIKSYIAGGGDGPVQAHEAEEAFVDAFSTALLAFLRNNPAFVEFVLA